MVDRQRQRSIDGYTENVRTVRVFLDALTPHKLDELLRINAETAAPDGFPAGGHGEGSKSSSEDTSTERAALRGLPDEESTESAYWTVNDRGERVRSDLWHRHNPPDPVGRQIIELLAHLVEMAGLSKRSVRVLNSIEHRPDLLKEKEQVMSRCNACERWVSGGDPPESLADDIDDPLDVVAGDLRSGYCSACHVAWVRLGKPGYPRRDVFERDRAERHQSAKDSRRGHVLEGMEAAQAKGVMPVRSAVAPGQHVGA